MNDSQEEHFKINPGVHEDRQFVKCFSKMGFQQQVTIATKKTESGARQTVTGMASI